MDDRVDLDARSRSVVNDSSGFPVLTVVTPIWTPFRYT
jgi:hypothetical protein